MKRLTIAISMIFFAILTILIVQNSGLSEDYLKTLFDIKNNSYPFSIQNIMWIFFFLGLGEILYRWIMAKEISKDIKKNILSKDEEKLLRIEDTRKLYMELNNKKDENSILPLILKKLILHFQTTNSIAQTQELLNSQMDIKYSEMNTEYSMIRYITWMIPTLGFIGTVTGISMALAYAANSDPTSKTFLGELTARLGVAFDTTLVALVMSAILVFFLHLVESYEEKKLANFEEYILDNFINKLYI